MTPPLPSTHSAARLVVAWLALATGTAFGQNDWQFPDPYFGVHQHRAAGTPQAERRYRAEIAPQQPPRLHDRRAPPAKSGPRSRRHRARAAG